MSLCAKLYSIERDWDKRWCRYWYEFLINVDMLNRSKIISIVYRIGYKNNIVWLQRFGFFLYTIISKLISLWLTLFAKMKERIQVLVGGDHGSNNCGWIFVAFHCIGTILIPRGVPEGGRSCWLGSSIIMEKVIIGNGCVFWTNSLEFGGGCLHGMQKCWYWSLSSKELKRTQESMGGCKKREDLEYSDSQYRFQ